MQDFLPTKQTNKKKKTRFLLLSPLQTGTCLPRLQGLNQLLLPLQTFNTPRKGLRVESRHQASALWERLAGQLFTQLGIFRSRCYKASACILPYLEKHRIASWGEDINPR